jgi:hypothetical protein
VDKPLLDKPTTGKKALDKPLLVKPILVKPATARTALDVGNTKFWELVKAGKIRMVDIGIGYRMVDYRSLEALRDSPTTATEQQTD